MCGDDSNCDSLDNYSFPHKKFVQRSIKDSFEEDNVCVVKQSVEDIDVTYKAICGNKNVHHNKSLLISMVFVNKH